MSVLRPPHGESWLPTFLSFLSGLPEDVRRRTLVMPFQAYVDDSGGPGHSKHFVLAGLVGHSEDWAAFSDEWRACLAEKPSIKVFKMSHAARRSGEFYRWTFQMRDEKLRNLARIVNRHAQLATYSIIDLEAHADVWAKRLGKPMNEPYFHPFYCTIMAVCFCLWDNGHRERFEIVFDDQVVFGLRAKAWWPVVRAMIESREAEAATILPVDPIFRSDDDFLPIQAADMYAWCFRKHTDDPTYRDFDWLLAEMPNVKGTDYSQYYDRERMESVLAMTMKELEARDFAPTIIKAYRETFGE